MDRAAAWSLCAVWALCALPSPCEADRDIVFAAARYVRSGTEGHDPLSDEKRETLREIAPSRLYRVNTDGSRLTKLTDRGHGDYRPRWSPDGQWVLFCRRDSKDSASIQMMHLGTGVTHRLLRGSDEVLWYGTYAWSPDGRWIAIHTVNYHHADSRPQVRLVDARTRRSRSLGPFWEFAWSPDSRRIVLAGGRGPWNAWHCEIRTLSGRRTVRVGPPIMHPAWLDRSTIIGDEAPGHQYDPHDTLAIVGIDGRRRRRVRMVRADGQDEACTSFFTDRRFWRRIPGARDRYLVDTQWHRSDGTHYACHVVNVGTRSRRLLLNGELLGASPDGRRIAAATTEWVGPYKRGGQRVGPLEIVDVETAKRRAITPALWAIAGGDWRRQGPRHERPRK